jgi:hypothetical protein
MRLLIACAVAFVTLFVQGEGARDHLRALVNHDLQSGGALEGCNGSGGKCDKNKDCCSGLSCGSGGKCSTCNGDGGKCDTNGDCCDGLSCGAGGICSTCNGDGGKCDTDGDCCDGMSCGGATIWVVGQPIPTSGECYISA